jgi:hypothetical protein
MHMEDNQLRQARTMGGVSPGGRAPRAGIIQDAAHLEPVCDDGEPEVVDVAEVHQVVSLLARPAGGGALRPEKLLVLVVGVTEHLGLTVGGGEGRGVREEGRAGREGV